MSLLSTYKSSLKKTASEEVLDLLIFRPLGFLVAVLLKPTFITPNAVTVMAMLLGIASGASFYFYSYELGALFLFLSNLLDCSDGQLARMKKTASKIGRVLDGFADYVTYTFVYLGITFAWMRDSGHNYFFWIALVMAASTLVQAALFDDYRNRYISSDTIEDMQEEVKEFQELKKESKSLFIKFISIMYIQYTKKQIRLREKKPNLKVSSIFIRLLSFVGSTTHISLLIACALLKRLDWYFYAIIVPFNLFMGVLLLLQKPLNKGRS